MPTEPTRKALTSSEARTFYLVMRPANIAFTNVAHPQRVPSDGRPSALPFAIRSKSDHPNRGLAIVRVLHRLLRLVHRRHAQFE